MKMVSNVGKSRIKNQSYSNTFESHGMNIAKCIFNNSIGLDKSSIVNNLFFIQYSRVDSFHVFNDKLFKSFVITD